MKKIINGFRYDTDRAIAIGSYDTGLGWRDFKNWEATLYITPRSGNYFIAGTGGPMTRFSQPAGNMTSGGSKIIPMSKEEAFAWAQEFLDDDIIEEYFEGMIKEA
jgi:hypothetical protein